MNNDSNYISLQEAAKNCHYSQEYLSLRARQGKLKAVKFGRNWITKKEWLEEYLEKVEEYNNKNHLKKLVSPPKNLPVEKIPVFRFGFVTALVFVLLVAGCFWGKESFKNVYRDIEPYTYIAGGAGDIIVENTIEILAETVSDIPQTFATVSLSTASIGDTFKEYGQWIGKSTSEWFSSQIKEIVKNYIIANNFVEKKIGQGYRVITQLWTRTEKIAEEKLIPKSSEEGLVVIPSTAKDEEVKEKIKESFSDEVKVEIKDETSGVIIPVFKKGEGEKYLYILVPIKSEL